MEQPFVFLSSLEIALIHVKNDIDVCSCYYGREIINEKVRKIEHIPDRHEQLKQLKEIRDFLFRRMDEKYPNPLP